MVLEEFPNIARIANLSPTMIVDMTTILLLLRIANADQSSLKYAEDKLLSSST